MGRRGGIGLAGCEKALLDPASTACVDAASVVYIVAAVATVVGALIAARFMPAHDIDTSQTQAPQAALDAPPAGAVPEPVPLRIDEG